ASTGDTCFARIAAPSAVAERSAISVMRKYPSYHPAAAIDQQGLTGDVARVVARQECDDAGDILRLGDEAGRRRRLDALDHRRCQAVMRAGADRARRDGVDRHAKWRELARQRTR